MYTHSIPDEHRANEPLKDSCELYKHWNQKWARHQPSEMQIGNRRHLHRLNPTAPKQRHPGRICHVGTHRPLYIFSTQWFHWFGVQQLGNQIFHCPWETDFPPPSSSLLNRRGTRAGGKPLKLLVKIDCILYSRKRSFLYYCSVQYI